MTEETDKKVLKKIKIAPNSKESEMMVLGCMLTSVNSLNIAADSLSHKDFYYYEHQTIFSCLHNAYKSDRSADVHLICEELRRIEKLEEVGGPLYVTTLAQYAGTSAYIEEYIEIVKNKSLLRKMIEAAQGIEKKSFDEPKDVSSLLDEAQNTLFVISQDANQKEGLLIKDLLDGKSSKEKLPYLKELQARQENYYNREPGETPVTGLPTHFKDLDTMINGLNPANLVIIAGRPSMGKTALAINMVERIAIKNNEAVAIFSLEMTSEELIHRMICSQAEVESDRIRTGSLDGMEYQRIVEAVNNLKKQKIIIDDQPGLKITDLRARARRLKEIYDVKLLVIDYMQLLSGAKTYYNPENRQSEISEISRMLKTLARELNIPIICGSQLSRKVEERAGHRPMLSDLRESGSIEQDADIVMLLFRPEYYNPQHKPGLAEIIVAKNRHGKVGSVNLTYRKSLAQFQNYTPIEPEEPNTSASSFAAFSP
ncbi:MAG: replicative DNA helicase [Simkaniaceae bacterium]|nr:replicative DNA helicase [Simkaniaceae bacterium]